MKHPTVSWLIPTTLYRHKWWKRLVEFLEEDFPSEQIECIFLGTQDKHFREEAQRIGERIYQSLRFAPGAAEKWKRVHFIEAYDPTFNIAASRNMLLDAAKGSIVLYRDADTALIRSGFTAFAVKELLRSRYGMLSFPSLRNGSHFKPKPSLVTVQDPVNPGLRLACSVNGMATTALKSVLKELGGWNSALHAWGEHTALCTKMARAGLLMGYTDRGYWLGTDTSESDISLTDDRINPRSIVERRKAIALLRAFYDITPRDKFWNISQQDYGVGGHDLQYEVDRTPLYQHFSSRQRLNSSLEKYLFKPWECLSHPDTPYYIAEGAAVAYDFYHNYDVHRLQGGDA